MPAPPDAITPEWTIQHVLLADSVPPALWDRLRGRTDLVLALESIARDPAAHPTARMNAPGWMAVASDGTAARRLIALWSDHRHDPGFAVAILLAFGALDPDEALRAGVYAVLEDALVEGPEPAIAAQALADLGTPTAARLLRARAEREQRPQVLDAIRRSLHQIERQPLTR